MLVDGEGIERPFVTGEEESVDNETTDSIYTQWRRNEFESGGNFLSCPFTFLALQVVVFVSAFVMEVQFGLLFAVLLLTNVTRCHV